MTSDHTDRELLELAAKAAGYKFRVSREWHSLEVVEVFIPNSGPKEHLCWHRWNPPEDDGDALRLAARWMMDVEIGTTHVTATIPLAIPIVSATEEFIDGDQRLPMTRRAIVRAAAAMADGGEHG